MDGERLDPITGGPVSGGNHPYYAHFDIPWSKAKKIAYANTVEGKVEEKEFELNYAQLAPLREFLRLVTP